MPSSPHPSENPSPGLARSTRATFTVKVEGQAIDEARVVSIDIWSEVAQVPRAKLVLSDERDFALSNQKTFLPGNRVEIAAGYDQKNSRIFTGVIVKHGIEAGQDRARSLVIEAADRALAMTLGRRSAVFEKTTDGDVIGKLIARNGLAKDVAATGGARETIVQHDATDWEMVLRRARRHGLAVVVDAGKVTVKRPDTRQPPALRLANGDSVLAFRAEMDAATQLAPSAIKSQTWDVAKQRLAGSGPGQVSVKEQGNVSSAELAGVFAVDPFTQQTGAPIEPASLEGWSTAALLESMLSKIRGEVSFLGSAQARTGTTLELSGFGRRFDGTAYVSGVHHRLADGHWQATARLGLAAETLAAGASEAAGLLPPIHGLQIGRVKHLSEDPSGQFRVQVDVPLLLAPNDRVWARLASFYASTGVGAQFYPEIGDEVVLAFMNGDPRFPVILGSLYSGQHPPPTPPGEKNDRKALVTRGKLELSFDDGDQAIEVRTPGGLSVRLDDQQKQVRIQDSHRNSVVLSASGISLKSASKVDIEARGDVRIETEGVFLVADRRAKREPEPRSRPKRHEVERGIERALEPFASAPNDAGTWRQVIAGVSDYLRDLWTRGELFGATEREAFEVRCGLGSTMTDQDLIEGFLIVMVTLQLERPAEFIELIVKQRQESAGLTG